MGQAESPVPIGRPRRGDGRRRDGVGEECKIVSLRTTIRIALLLVFMGCVGCGTEPGPHWWLPEPQPGPGPDTPENAIKRFVWAYQNRKDSEYSNLLTEDFTFEFSNAVDPELAQKYSTGWFKPDEVTSARNLFQGFTDEHGVYHPGVTSIDITLAQTFPAGDGESRDTTRFKVLATTMDGLIVVPPGPGQTEETRYVIDSDLLRLFLVRGDAQFDSTGRFVTPAGQPADSTRWYIYRCIDGTGGWGAVKDQYR